MFAKPGNNEALERGETLTPSFDENGLIAAIATARRDRRGADAGVDERRGAAADPGDRRGALLQPLARGALAKGETSGQVQAVVEIRIDCDQDAVWLKVIPQGDGGACHVGFRSCFYRVVEDGALVERP